MKTEPVLIPLRKRSRIVAYALVDVDDTDCVLPKRWNLAGGYAVEARAALAGRSAPMHRQILGLAPSDRVVHHVNENKLDNRRANLEICLSKAEANSRPHPIRDARRPTA